MSGIWEPSSITSPQAVCRNYGGYYKYQIEASNGVKLHYCPGDTNYWNTFLGKEMVTRVRWYRPWENDGHGGFQILGTQETRKTWNAEFRQGDNDSKLFETITVNRSSDTNEVSFTIQPRYRNRGTQIWTRSNVELVAVNSSGKEVPSQFYDSSTWKSTTRIRVNQNSSGYGNNSIAPFTFNLDIPSDTEFGKHEQCFVITNEPWQGWERRDTFCLTIDVQMTFEEKQEYFCPLPHEIYTEQDESSELIGYLEQDTEFIIIEHDDTWSQIFTPPNASFEEGYALDSHDKGWIKNDLDCFTESEIVENIISLP